ncbi:MAG: Smr/MutS family protein [Saprospiraceae bacterium]|jgi:DNA mismatch repair protein MutS2|nr:Smr/MutS family protein [Saprospiraceae bacterium]
MLLFPDDILHTLEFTKIREFTAEMCLGAPGREIAEHIKPATDASIIRRRLEETDEWSRTLIGPNPMPFGEYYDIGDALKYLEITDYILDIEDLLHIRLLLLGHQSWHLWHSVELHKAYPVLCDLIQQLPFEAKPLKDLERVFETNGEVKDDASPQLKSIRRAIANRNKELEKTFQTLVQVYRKQGLLTESGESVRNGRRVLTVPAEHKRKIRGIIHDESATGKTVFLEPEQLVELNNDLFELESEERLEILRILKALCQLLQPFSQYLKLLLKLTIRFDLIRAKAKVSQMYNGNRPEIVNEMHLKLLRAYHPLLWIKNRQANRTVVPFTLELNPQHRILVLSGPNAGGKSITMKSVILIQMLAQSGYLVPASPHSQLPVYQKCFADIGDQQSLDDDLSTYSSKLRNMRRFLELADKRTLIALDEFGSGTDPKMGGAIAESILRSLNKFKVMGVVTTHYSNLKMFAFKEAGLVNGAMDFDQVHLRPAYSLRVGKPGSSYAFEIATSSGLPGPVLDYAKELIGPESQAVEQLLVDLQNERRNYEELSLISKEKQRQLDQLILSYESMFRDLEFQRKRLKLETKELALLQKSKESVIVEEYIKELKEERSLERALLAKETLQIEQQRLRKQVHSVQEEVNELQNPLKSQNTIDLAPGAFVRLKTGGAIGEILTMDKRKAQISVGGMTMIAPLNDLEVIREPLSIRTKASVRLPDTSDENIANRLDIRGFKKEEAMRVIELFLDKALMTSSRSVRILHGKGNGTLRKTVMQKAKEYKDIRAIEPGAPEDGGDGVTILRFG